MLDIILIFPRELVIFVIAVLLRMSFITFLIVNSERKEYLPRDHVVYFQKLFQSPDKNTLLKLALFVKKVMHIVK